MPMKQTVGEQLRSARKSRGISLDEVVKGTHIRLNYLQELENDHPEMFKSETQARGFLRLYASYLSIPSAPLIEQWQKAVHAESEIEEGGNVSAETSRRLSCDAGVVHWLENKKGEPLSVGRKTRTIPPAIRRALNRRDGGCRFPGCTCSRFVDAHHITHWADGGETSVNNLVLLCRRHHRMVHEEGFGLHSQADGRIYFTDPQGHKLPDAGETRFRGNVLSKLL